MIYRLATLSGDKCALSGFILKNHAPPKVKFFAWLLLQNSIQCKANLKKKNILDSDVCELCKCSAETASHLIFGCSIAQSFWRHIGWDPLRIPPAADLWQIEAQADAPSRSPPTMILLCCWNLWLHRHDVVFRRRDPSLRQLLFSCREAAELWRWRLPPAQRSDVEYWRTRFVM